MSNQQATHTISRRHFLQITAVASTVFLSGRWLSQRAATSLSESRLLMGTVINLTVLNTNRAQGQQAIAATFAEMERLVTLFNWRLPNSPLALLNENGRLLHPPAELVDLLLQAQQISALSAGAFDVTMQPLLTALRTGTNPDQARQLVDYRQMQISDQEIRLASGMQVTLDGIAKGRVVDGGTAVLQTLGYKNILVEAGGDLVAQGSRSDGQPWRIGVTHPRRTDTPLSVLPITNQAAATSGDYQHSFSQDFSSHHIIDPRQAVSPAALASVTVLAPTAALADGLSTAVMVLGPQQGITLIDQLPETAALLVTKQMKPIRSARFPAA